MTRTPKLVLLLAAIALTLTGCSASSKVSTATGTATTAAKSDSGVAACKTLAGMGPDSKFTEASHQAMHDQFAGSSSADLSKAGTTFVDDAYKVDQTQDLTMLSTILGDYVAISRACASHGQVLPALSS